MKKYIWIGLFLGGTVGGLIPSLWGADSFSISGIIFSLIGSIFGIWLGFKTGEYVSE